MSAMVGWPNTNTRYKGRTGSDVFAMCSRMVSATTAQLVILVLALQFVSVIAAQESEMPGDMTQALLDDEHEVLPGLQAFPKQPDPISNPRRYTHKFTHLGKKSGMFTKYEYMAEIGEHVVLLDKHVQIESMECKTVPESIIAGYRNKSTVEPNEEPTALPSRTRHSKEQSEQTKKAPASSSFENAFDREDFHLEVELTLYKHSIVQVPHLGKGTILSGAADWGDCRHNSTHRRGKVGLLHRIVSTPAVEHEEAESRVTYRFLAETASFHEMLKDFEMSYYHGPFTQHDKLMNDTAAASSVKDSDATNSKKPSGALQDEQEEAPQHHNATGIPTFIPRDILPAGRKLALYGCPKRPSWVGYEIPSDNNEPSWPVAGTDILIRWDTDNDMGNRVKIKLHESNLYVGDYTCKTVSTRAPNTGRYLYTIPHDIHSDCWDSTSFPDFYFSVRPADYSGCSASSSTFYIAYNYYEDSRRVSAFEEDEFELYTSSRRRVTLSMDLSGQMAGFVYLQTSNYNPFQAFSSYFMASLSHSSQGEVSLSGDGSWDDTRSGTIMSLRSIPGMAKRSTILGISFVLGCKRELLYDFHADLRYEASLSMELVEQKLLEIHAGFWYHDGDFYTLGDISPQPSFGDKGFEIAHEVNGNLEISVTPRIYVGIWGSSSIADIELYASIGVSLYLQAQLAFRRPELGPVPRAYDSTNCRSDHRLRLGLFWGAKDIKLRTYFNGAIRIFGYEFSSSFDQTYNPIGDFGPHLLFGMCFIQNTVASASPTTVSPTASPLCDYFTEVNENEGSFANSNSGHAAVYHDNTDCYWWIHPRDQAIIQLEFIALATEAYFDTVVVYDCKELEYDENDNVIRTSSPSFVEDGLVYQSSTCNWQAISMLSGSLVSYNSSDYVFQSSSAYGLVVHFRSDGSVNYGGWEATYTPIRTCMLYADMYEAIADYSSHLVVSGTPTTVSDHRVASHGEPTDYAPNTDCWWVISNPMPGQSIQLRFTRFATEASYDFVNVTGVSPLEPNRRHMLQADYVITTLRTFHGRPSTSGMTVQTHDPMMLVRFTSDSTVQFHGFEMQYMYGTDFCDTLTHVNVSGVLSTWVSEPYRDGMTCTWRIANPSTRGVRLRVTPSGLVSGSSVFVYYGWDHEDKHVLTEILASENATVQVDACTSFVSVHFASATESRRRSLLQSSSAVYGFHAEYEATEDACVQPTVPLGWTCAPEKYSAQDACDCECGTYDPDCDSSTPLPVRGCENAFLEYKRVLPPEISASLVAACSSGSHMCFLDIPAAWICESRFYAANDGCDCGCGAYDPDCGTLFNATDQHGYIYNCDMKCSPTCFGRTCDEWAASGYTCANLVQWGCDCDGCACSNNGFLLVGASPCYGYFTQEVGNAVFAISSRTQEDCEYACAYDRQCTGFTWISQQETCDLMYVTISAGQSWYPQESSAACYAKAATPTLMCDDSCELAADGVCQDGGENDAKVYEWPELSCQIGTDCTDCGATPASESAIFTMESGACELVAGGGCITSPNFLNDTGHRNQYPHNSECLISLNSAATLVVLNFDLERDFDFLRIGQSPVTGPLFTGSISDSAIASDSTSDSESNINDDTDWINVEVVSDATGWATIPLAFKVGSGFIIKFFSDGSISSGGFNICTREAACTKHSMLTFASSESGSSVSTLQYSRPRQDGLGHYVKVPYKFSYDRPVYRCLGCVSNQLQTYLQFYGETNEWKIGLKSHSNAWTMSEVFWKVRSSASEAGHITGTWQQQLTDGSWISQADMKMRKCDEGGPDRPIRSKLEANVVESSTRDTTYCTVDSQCANGTLPKDAACDYNIYLNGDGICPTLAPPAQPPASPLRPPQVSPPFPPQHPPPSSPNLPPPLPSTPRLPVPSSLPSPAPPLLPIPILLPPPTTRPSPPSLPVPGLLSLPPILSTPALPLPFPVIQPSPSSSFQSPQVPFAPPPPASVPSSSPPLSPSTSLLLPPPPSPLSTSFLPTFPPEHSTVVVPAVTSGMIFPLLDIAFFGNAAFRNSFEEEFKKDLAFSAGVKKENIVINSIRSGSVRVDSTVYFSIRTKGNLESFMFQLQNEPAKIFTAEFWQPFGDVVARDLSNVSMLYSYPPTPISQEFELQPPPDAIDEDELPNNLTGSSPNDNMSSNGGLSPEATAEASSMSGTQVELLLPLAVGGGVAFALLACVLGICMYRMKVAKAKKELTTEWPEQINPMCETRPTVL